MRRAVKLRFPLSKEDTAEIVDVLTDRLRHLMQEHQVRAAPLARSADLNESAVRDILRGRSKNPGIVTLQKIASVLNLRPSALFEAGELWPIIGDVANAGDVLLYGRDAPQQSIENPFFAVTPGRPTALKVVDDSLAPFGFTGDHIVVCSQSDDTPNDPKRPSLCELKDGRRLIRFARPGAADGLHTILPVNPFATAEADVVIKTQSPVLMVLPSWFSATSSTPTHASSAALHEGKAAYKPKRRR